MKTHIKPKKETWLKLSQRPVKDPEEFDPIVKKVLKSVKEGGDQALKEMTLKI